MLPTIAQAMVGSFNYSKVTRACAYLINVYWTMRFCSFGKMTWGLNALASSSSICA